MNKAIVYQLRGPDSLPKGAGSFVYVLAGQTLLSSISLPILEGFRHLDRPPGSSNSQPHTRLSGEPIDRASSTRGLIGGVHRNVAATHSASETALEIEGIGTFRLDFRTRAIEVLRPTVASESIDFAESLLGPLLALLFQRDHIYFLHASAVEIAGRAVLFVGESGTGKSTLADAPATVWPRVADDVVPVTVGPTGLKTLPNFPQLKLRGVLRAAEFGDSPLPAREVFAIDATALDGDTIAIEPQSASRAALTIATHTVASRLFSPSGLEAHLDFCARAALAANVSDLRYPRGLDRLPAIRAEIIERLREGISPARGERSEVVRG